MPQPSAPNREIEKGFLRRRSDYLKTYKGHRVRKELFVLYGCGGKAKMHRFGITASKSIGSAVVRNQYKRWCRELYRKTSMANLKEPLDINLFLGNKQLKKDDFKNATFGEFKDQFDEAIKRLIKTFS